MFSIKDLKIDAKATLGGNLLLVDVIPYYRYSNGIKTNDVEGFKYVVVCPENDYEKISVKIPGDKLMERTAEKVAVEFKDLDVYVYFFNNRYNVGARATSIKKL